MILVDLTPAKLLANDLVFLRKAHIATLGLRYVNPIRVSNFMINYFFALLDLLCL